MNDSEDKYIQYIVVDKTLGMSKGKLSAQVSHASMAFLTHMIQCNMCREVDGELLTDGERYYCDMQIDKELYDKWISGIYTKVVLSAKGKSGLEKVIRKAEENGLVEGKDFFCIRDACLTELTPDETGTCFTCIGFIPASKEKMEPVVKRLQLFRE